MNKFRGGWAQGRNGGEKEGEDKGAEMQAEIQVSRERESRVTSHEMDRREKAKGEGRGGGAAQVYRNAEKEKAAGAAARAFSSQPGLIARTRVFIVDFYWGSGNWEL